MQIFKNHQANPWRRRNKKEEGEGVSAVTDIAGWGLLFGGLREVFSGKTMAWGHAPRSSSQNILYSLEPPKQSAPVQAVMWAETSACPHITLSRIFKCSLGFGSNTPKKGQPTPLTSIPAGWRPGGYSSSVLHLAGIEGYVSSHETCRFNLHNETNTCIPKLSS